MQFSDVLTLIGSYAFPIVMCVAFFWRQYKSDESFKEELKDLRNAQQEELKALREAHQEEVLKCIEAINNNTQALQRLVDRLEAMK